MTDQKKHRYPNSFINRTQQNILLHFSNKDIPDCEIIKGKTESINCGGGTLTKIIVDGSTSFEGKLFVENKHNFWTVKYHSDSQINVLNNQGTVEAKFIK